MTKKLATNIGNNHRVEMYITPSNHHLVYGVIQRDTDTVIDSDYSRMADDFQTKRLLTQAMLIAALREPYVIA